MIGTTVSHYKIIEQIGAGGMGEVYLAQDLKLERNVAIKFLPQQLTKDRDNVDRFQREAKAAASLNHPNIVTIYEIAEDGDQIFIVMEYVDGKTLREVLNTPFNPPFIGGKTNQSPIPNSQLPVPDVLNIISQIAEGLAKAHKAGIVHRDIKPENILIDKDGQVKILDFGLAKLKGVSTLTKEASTLGTIYYMSPEQVSGKEVDQRTDIWSLGVVLYEMLTGQLPFRGEYEQAVMYAILNEEPKQLKNISPELQDILKKSLVKNLDKRYKQANSIVEDLASMKTQTATEKSRPISIPKKNIRNNLIYLAAVILISVVFIILLNTNFFSGEPLHKSHSIAVLPFTNLSANQENEFFCDGITEDIIARLSKIGDLKVISRTSIMQYKTIKKSLPEIAEELNVTMILEGTVRQADDRVRIVAQLIEAKEDQHIWAETYDREMQDIFEIQSDVTERIAGILKVTLSPQEKSLIQKKPTKSIAAYNFYIKGREYYHRYQKEDNEQAIRLFKKALGIDPDYALAYAGLGDAYGMGYHRFGFSPAWIDSAIRISKKAIEIDPNSAEAFTALGVSYAINDRSELSIDAYKKAIELNPGYYRAVGNLGYRYLKVGRLNEAFEWNKKKIEINPAFSPGYVQIGLVYNALCEDIKAKQAFEKALELDPQNSYSRWGLISSYLAQNKYDKALAQSDQLLRFTSDSLNAFTYAGYVEHIQNHLSNAYHNFEEASKKSQAKFFYNYHIIPLLHLGAIQWKKGETDVAKNIFSEFLNYANKEIEAGNESWEIRYNMAGIYSIMGERDKAFLWLDRAIDLGWREYRIGKIEPLFENLREDKRFEKKIGRVKKIVDKTREQLKISQEL